MALYFHVTDNEEILVKPASEIRMKFSWDYLYSLTLLNRNFDVANDLHGCLLS